MQRRAYQALKRFLYNELHQYRREADGCSWYSYVVLGITIEVEANLYLPAKQLIHFDFTDGE